MAATVAPYHMSNHSRTDSAGKKTHEKEMFLVLEDAVTSAKFLKFLELEFNSENFEFIRDVQSFKETEERGLLESAALQQQALVICDRYIRVDSPRQINISEQVRLNVIDAVDVKKRSDSSIFDDAKAHAFHLLRTDVYPRFLRHLQAVQSTDDLTTFPQTKAGALRRASAIPSPTLRVTGSPETKEPPKEPAAKDAEVGFYGRLRSAAEKARVTRKKLTKPENNVIKSPSAEFVKSDGGRATMREEREEKKLGIFGRKGAAATLVPVRSRSTSDLIGEVSNPDLQSSPATQRKQRAISAPKSPNANSTTNINQPNDEISGESPNSNMDTDGRLPDGTKCTLSRGLSICRKDALCTYLSVMGVPEEDQIQVYDTVQRAARRVDSEYEKAPKWVRFLGMTQFEALEWIITQGAKRGFNCASPLPQRAQGGSNEFQASVQSTGVPDESSVGDLAEGSAKTTPVANVFRFSQSGETEGVWASNHGLNDADFNLGFDEKSMKFTDGKSGDASGTGGGSGAM